MISRSPSSRRTPRRRACGIPTTGNRGTPNTSSLTSARSFPASPGRSVRRTESRSPTPSRDSAKRCATSVATEELTGWDESVDESFPASDVPSHASGESLAPHEYGEEPADIGAAKQAGARNAERRHVVRPRPRRGGHRSDHLLHQHVQPERHDRRCAGRQEGGRARAESQAVGENDPGSWIEGRQRLLRPLRLDAVPGQAWFQPGRLRLHHLHRQLRAAHSGGQRGRTRT